MSTSADDPMMQQSATSAFGGDSSSLMDSILNNEGQAQQVAMAGAQNTKRQEQQIQNARPPVNHGALTAMPFLLGLTALGGAISGLHGRVMLGALSGMAKGAVDGNEQAFQDSVKTYNQNWKRLSSLFALQNQYYNELYQAYGKTAEGQVQALEMMTKITDDNFTQNVQIAKLNQGVAGLALKRQALAQQLLNMNHHEAIAQATLALRKAQIKQAISNGQFTPQEGHIAGLLENALGQNAATGFGGIPLMKQKIANAIAGNPGKSDQAIASMLVAGYEHEKLINAGTSYLAKRQVSVDAALQTIVGPGGNLDLAIKYAKEAGLADNKPINWSTLKASEYANAPAARKFVQTMGELRTDVAQAFARGNQTSEGANARALNAVPSVLTIQELEAMKHSIPALGGAAMMGTTAAENELITSGPGESGVTLNQSGSGGSAASGATSATTPTSYSSPDDVKKAYTSGAITRSEAISILKSKFGME